MRVRILFFILMNIYSQLSWSQLLETGFLKDNICERNIEFGKADEFPRYKQFFNAKYKGSELKIYEKNKHKRRKLIDVLKYDDSGFLTKQTDIIGRIKITYYCTYSNNHREINVLAIRNDDSSRERNFVYNTDSNIIYYTSFDHEVKLGDTSTFLYDSLGLLQAISHFHYPAKKIKYDFDDVVVKTPWYSYPKGSIIPEFNMPPKSKNKEPAETIIIKKAANWISEIEKKEKFKYSFDSIEHKEAFFYKDDTQEYIREQTSDKSIFVQNIYIEKDGYKILFSYFKSHFGDDVSITTQYYIQSEHKLSQFTVATYDPYHGIPSHELSCITMRERRNKIFFLRKKYKIIA